MAKYTKKPITIDAIQWTGINVKECIEFLGSSFVRHHALNEGGNNFNRIVIKTLEGEMIASKGDYLIRGIKGEHYPCKPDIFHASYEPLSQRDVSFKEFDFSKNRTSTFDIFKSNVCVIGLCLDDNGGLILTINFIEYVGGEVKKYIIASLANDVEIKNQNIRFLFDSILSWKKKVKGKVFLVGDTLSFAVIHNDEYQPLRSNIFANNGLVDDYKAGVENSMSMKSTRWRTRAIRKLEELLPNVIINNNVSIDKLMIPFIKDENVHVSFMRNSEAKKLDVKNMDLIELMAIVVNIK